MANLAVNSYVWILWLNFKTKDVLITFLVTTSIFGLRYVHLNSDLFTAGFGLG